jgi:NADH-quinone oxidoreductase subunit G
MIGNAPITIDGQKVALEGERNLLEVIRKAGIDLATFCYHSELSVYGACRLCIVEIPGRGIHAACSTLPEPGMTVLTNTQELREIRKIAIELLLAGHDQSCPTCAKNTSCRLQILARRLGIDKVRFQSIPKPFSVDDSTQSLVRDPRKCVLCGDCVRMCREVQGIGAIDFAHRGAAISVQPAFGKTLGQVECVLCGQCARVCPTGALTPKSDIEAVWQALEDKDKKVIAQIAPAVRVAIGEMFGLAPGTVSTGQLTAALKAIGFDKVFDTSFAADITVLEEGNEFLQRLEAGHNLPQFTSCCPGWVKYAEQYYGGLLSSLSTCRSPQQMFGALAKKILPETMGIKRENLVVVSIMPCTAKKFEARRPEFNQQDAEVDFVLTTQEIGRMIDTAGLSLPRMKPASLDLPLGYKTGAGVIFGVSGGVSEAVLRYVVEKVEGRPLDSCDFPFVRGETGVREATVAVNGRELCLAIVHGLANVAPIAAAAEAGLSPYHLIEVMACPGGCVGGAGQPVYHEPHVIRARTQAIYDTDKTLQLHKAQENPMVAQLYQKHLGEVGSHPAHLLLHTGYRSRRRIGDEDIHLGQATQAKLDVRVCVGTSCYLRGSQDILHALLHRVDKHGLAAAVEVLATFCFEQCQHGPSVSVGSRVLAKAGIDQVWTVIQEELALLDKNQSPEERKNP